MSRVEVHDRDRGWAALFKRAKEAREATAKVGVLADTKAGEEREGDLTVAEIAVVNEFGTDTIPARSFVRATFDKQRDRLADLGRELMGEVIDGEMTVKGALDAMGLALSSEIKAAITEGVAPPNAPSTMLRKAKSGRTGKYFKGAVTNLGKGFAQVGALAAVKPLIDTGRLLNAITWTINSGKATE